MRVPTEPSSTAAAPQRRKGRELRTSEENRDGVKVECPRCGNVYTKEESAPEYTCPDCGTFYGEAEPVDGD